MEIKIRTLLLFTILIYSSISQNILKQFTSNIIITKDPSLGVGSLLTISPAYYDSINSLMRFDYPNLQDPVSNNFGFTEIFDFNKHFIYQLCKKCNAYTYPYSMPIFYKEPTDIISNNRSSFVKDNKVCNPYLKSSPKENGVKWLWLNDQGIPCKAEKIDGTIYEFNSVKKGAPSPSVFSLPPNNTCPSIPKCSAPIDLVLVLDESGSISRDDFLKMISFADKIINSFEIGLNATQVGLVFFSGIDYHNNEDPASCCGLSDPALKLSFDPTTIKNFLTSHQQSGGHTCINCGIKTATTYEPNRNRPTQVPKIMLVLTDGYNNRMTDFFLADVQNAKNLGWNMFAIGVKDASRLELQEIASNKNQVFMIDDFNALSVITGNVANDLCGAYPLLTPCGSNCLGKCACGGNCICPDVCVPQDKCSVGSCKNGVSGSQCIFTKKFCNPLTTNGNMCKENVCNPNTGKCGEVDKDCKINAPDSCFEVDCDKKSGCIYKDKCSPVHFQPDTEIPSLCYNRTCFNAQCSETKIQCKSPNACTISSCDPSLGCVSSPVNCEDGNMCTTKTCDPYLGCKSSPITCPTPDFFQSNTYLSDPDAFKCFDFTCDPKVGCIATNKSCDDNNMCTNDYCDKKTGMCVNDPITCTKDPNNKCLAVFCDEKVGCLSKEKNCDDNIFCTIDSCEISTGKCKNTPLTCSQPSDKCYTSTCDSTAKKCVLQPKVFCNQPSDKCQKSVCNSTSGLCDVITPFICNPPNLCSISFCESGACINQPKNCDDKDSCTLDSCDLSTGSCVYTKIENCNKKICNSCTTTDPCNPVKCENGECITIPFQCPPNKCATIVPKAINGSCVCTQTNPTVCSQPSNNICGQNVCDPLTGICSTINNRVCDDNDPCTTDQCVISDGKPTCKFTSIQCSGDSICSRKKCINSDGYPLCVDDPSNTRACTSNECSKGICDSLTGQCSYIFTPCSNPSNTTCSRKVCNPVSGKCEASVPLQCPELNPVGCGKNGICIYTQGSQQCKYEPVCISDDPCTSTTCQNFNNGTTCQQKVFNCDDNNPCTNEYCISDGVDSFGNPKTKCISSSNNKCTPSNDVCKLNVCVNQNGKAACEQRDVACNSTSKCLVGKCVNQNGKATCQYSDFVCGVADRCVNYVCDPIKGCSKISKCDDGNPCTNDNCDLLTGECSYSQIICNTTNFCKKAFCDSSVGCVEQPLDCVKDKNLTIPDTCHFPVCNNLTGCEIAVIPNSLDACNYCNQPGKCKINKSPVPAGAIAGAIIGASVVVGVAALAMGFISTASNAASFIPGTEGAIMGGDRKSVV